MNPAFPPDTVFQLRKARKDHGFATCKSELIFVVVCCLTALLAINICFCIQDQNKPYSISYTLSLA